MTWEVNGGKKVKIEGREYEVSNADDLVEKIKLRARELGFRTFVVQDADGNELEPEDIREQFDEISEVRLGKYDTPAASSSLFFGEPDEIEAFQQVYPETKEMDAVFLVHKHFTTLPSLPEEAKNKKMIFVFASADGFRVNESAIGATFRIPLSLEDHELDFPYSFVPLRGNDVRDADGHLVAKFTDDVLIFSDVYHYGERYKILLEMMKTFVDGGREALEEFLISRTVEAALLGSSLVLDVQVKKIQKLSRKHVEKLTNKAVERVKRIYEARIAAMSKRILDLTKKISMAKKDAVMEGVMNIIDIIDYAKRKDNLWSFRRGDIVYKGKIKPKVLVWKGKAYRLRENNPFFVEGLKIKLKPYLDTNVYAMKHEHPNIKNMGHNVVCIGSLRGEPLTLDNLLKLPELLKTVNMDSAYWGTGNVMEWIDRYALSNANKIWNVGVDEEEYEDEEDI